MLADAPIQTVGLMRICLSRDSRKPGLSWLQSLMARPLYWEIIDLGRAAGLSAATAEDLQATSPQDNQVCVELIGSRTKLEEFYQQILPWMGDNRIVLVQ